MDQTQFQLRKDFENQSLSQPTVQLPIADLIITDERREVDPEAMDGLRMSISALGLLNPITVVHDGQKFKVICGRRRTRAVMSLGLKFIPAIVHEMSGIEQQMAVITENVHRLEPTSSERDEGIREFIDLYYTLYPDCDQQAHRKKLSKLTGVNISGPTEQPSAMAAASKAFGCGRDVVKRAIRRSKALTEAQRKVLEVNHITERQLDVICSLDEEQIAEVVKLIASGFNYEEAIRDAEVLNNPDEPQTAEELLKVLPARRHIIDPEAYDNDVTMFLMIKPHLDKVKHLIGWAAMKRTFGMNAHGLYYRRVALFLESPHPRHWTSCRCQLLGRTNLDAVANCNNCRGGGFQIGA